MRRCATGGSVMAMGGLLAACGGGDDTSDTGTVTPPPPPNNGASWLMPDEAGAHKATWMAFGTSDAIWTRAQVPQVQQALARIANAIAAYEPVNMLVRQDELADHAPCWTRASRSLPPSWTTCGCATRAPFLCASPMASGPA